MDTIDRRVVGAEELLQVTWAGWLGNSYRYRILGKLPADLSGSGNFIWARRDPEEPRGWRAIYVGESVDLPGALTSQAISSCAARHGATDLHVRIHPGDQRARGAEAQELRDLYFPPGNAVRQNLV